MLSPAAPAEEPRRQRWSSRRFCQPFNRLRPKSDEPVQEYFIETNQHEDNSDRTLRPNVKALGAPDDSMQVAGTGGEQGRKEQKWQRGAEGKDGRKHQPAR